MPAQQFTSLQSFYCQLHPYRGPRISTKIACTQHKAVLYDLHDRLVPYKQAWEWQKSLVKDVEVDRNTVGTILLLQHPPVYTLGAGSTENNLLFDIDSPPAPVYRTERGGEVTYHGPGQLVVYPILNLKALKPDLHWYLRSLEEVVMQTLDQVSGLQGKRVEGLTGVWVNDMKVAAIGVRATRWISYHGLALNVATDLAPFQSIVPCGISDRRVTSVKDVLLDMAAIDDPYHPVSVDGLDVGLTDAQLMDEYAVGLMEALQDVFDVEVTESKVENESLFF